MTGLPVQLDSFVGRSDEVEAILRLARRERLTTLVGPGGIGKTRLAIEVARRLLDEEELDALYFVDLVRTSDPDLVDQVVLGAMGAVQEPGRSRSETIAGVLGMQRSLLVVDNCEHLIEMVSRHVDSMLRQVPSLRVIATSREPLAIAGEARWTVPALDDSACIQLFADRAGVTPDELAAGIGTAAEVADLCRHLDRMPLAIELAAARARHLPVNEILRRLDKRFELLTQGGRLSAPRHQTLEAAIDWSYGLLAAEERRALRVLSLFAGGFSVDAARAVASCNFATIGALAEKSMIVAGKGAGDMARYRMLETIREFAFDRLKSSSAEGAGRSKHFEFFAGFAGEAAAQLRGPEQGTWKDRLEEELPNIQTALEWGVANIPGDALVMAVDLIWFWKTRGHIAEGRAWLKRLVAAAPDSSPMLLAAAITEAGDFASLLGDIEVADKEVDSALELYLTFDDPRGRARALLSKAWIASRRVAHISEIAQHAASAVLEAERSGDELMIAECLLFAGYAADESGQSEEAKLMLERAVAICRRLNDAWTLALAINSLGRFYRRRGDFGPGMGLLTEDLELCRSVGDKLRIGLVLATRGMERLNLSDEPGARADFEASLTTEGTTGVAAVAMLGLAKLAAKSRSYERALRLVGAGASIPHWYGPSRFDFNLDSQPWLPEARRALGGAKVNSLWREGAAMRPMDAVSYALSDADVATTEGPLTKREQDIARLVAKGLRNREIAASMFISPRTVDAHVEHIRNKLGFQSRAQIAAWVTDHEAAKA